MFGTIEPRRETGVLLDREHYGILSIQILYSHLNFVCREQQMSIQFIGLWKSTILSKLDLGP